MPKLICYSLFSGPREKFEMNFYIRGFYFNARMNNLLYPDWRTHLEIDSITYSKYAELFDWLVQNNNLSLHINEITPPLCEAMLWRMKSLFTIDVSHILCRDADAITTYREAQSVQSWLESGAEFHAIHDNSAHGGIMGGMCGFDCAKLKAICKWNSFEEMINGHNLNEHGSDQHFLNSLPIKNQTRFDNLKPEPVNALPQVDQRLWESNLTCRHVGSPGVVEMETLRFFQRHDSYNWKYDVIEKKYPNLFYWHL